MLIKKEEQDTKGRLTTPVFSKTCWFRDITCMREARQQFASEARGYLGGEYWQLLQTLRSLPSVLEGSGFAQQAQTCAAQLPQPAAQGITWYGQLWG